MQTELLQRRVEIVPFGRNSDQWVISAVVASDPGLQFVLRGDKGHGGVAAQQDFLHWERRALPNKLAGREAKSAGGSCSSWRRCG
eukprot:6492500-Amphidinium_carterae.2